MHVTRLRIRDLRRLEEVEIRPGAGTNLLCGWCLRPDMG